VANGDVIAVEVDLSAKLLWFQDFTKASGWSNANFTFTGANPGAGTGGVGYSVLWTFTGEGTTGVVPCWSGNLSSKGQMKTKLTAFSAPVSSGFTAWDPP
jgi:hypothetical protein